MFKFLLPKETCFFDFFEEHCALTIEACKKLVAMVEAKANLAAYAGEIAELEHKTDSLTHLCIRALQQTFITPFDRSQIHDLICGLDDIVDAVDDASSRIVLYEMTEIPPEIKRMAELILEAVLSIEGALKQMRNLKNEPEIKTMCIAVHRLENDADCALRSFVKRMFKENSNAIEVMKWKEISEHLEQATDRCEDVADIIQGIIIEAS
jgi:uncharacterized protein